MNKSQKPNNTDSSQKALMLYYFYNRMCFICHTGQPCYVKMAVLRQSFRELLQAFPEVTLNV